MHINSSHTYSLVVSGQRGAVLIVVLLFLVLIMLVGIIAVRNSTTDLKLATSDQINTVLLQSSDNVNNKIEMSVNGDPTGSEHKQIMSDTGIFGYYLLSDSTDNDIISFCYRPQDNLFNIDKAVIRRNNGVLVSNNAGYCNPALLNDYTSARHTTMTQVMIKNASLTAATEADTFMDLNLNSDTNVNTGEVYTFDIYSTSTLPAYGSAEVSKVQECFKKDASSTTDGIIKCMTEYNIPSKMLVQRVDITDIEGGQAAAIIKEQGDGSMIELIFKERFILQPTQWYEGN